MSVNPGSTPGGLLQNAQQTSLGTQGHGMLPRIWMPERGLVLRSSLPNMPADACTVAQNVRWNGIAWTTQNIGWTQQRAPVFGNGPFQEMAIHGLTSGAQTFVAQAGTQVFAYDPTILPLDTETLLFTASNQTIPCMRSFSPNYFLYCNGVDYPQYWNGARVTNSFTTLGCFPFANGSVNYDRPNLVELYVGRAVWAGFPGNPYAIVFSNFLDPTTITINNVSNMPTYGGIYTVPSQLGPVTSLKSLQVSLTSTQQVLLVGCLNGFAIIQGTDATNFTLVVVQSGKWGIPSNRAWFVIDTTAFVMCTDGVRPISGNAYQSNLVSSCVTFPVHPIIKNWNWVGAGATTFCLDNPGELEATFYLSSGGDIINRTALILNYSDLANGLVRFSTKVFPSLPSGGTQMSPACGISYKSQYFCGGFDGILQKHYTNNTWNGTDIQYLMGSPLLQSATPAEEASMKGVYIMHQGDTTQFNASAYTYKPQSSGDQGMRRTLAFSEAISFSTAGTTGLGTTFALGSAAFGGAQYNLTPFYPDDGGRAWEIQLSGNTSNGDLNFVGLFAILLGGGTRQ